MTCYFNYSLGCLNFAEQGKLLFKWFNVNPETQMTPKKIHFMLDEDG